MTTIRGRQPDECHGERFGAYRVFEQIGTGGMGSVHRASCPGGRAVALKRLHDHLARDPAQVAAFVREAQLAALCGHPNVVRPIEVGRVERTYFIAFELLRGRDLRAVMDAAAARRAPAPVHVVVALLDQLLDALQHIHGLARAGRPLALVHRDVSPANLIVAASGHLTLIDFGIATARGLRDHAAGTIRGKLAYVAPEALEGEADHRGDLFAAAVIGHELLTGRALLAGDDDLATLVRVTELAIAPPSAANPAVPGDLDALLMRALARRPVDRWSSAGAMRGALAEVIARHRLAATPRAIAAYLGGAGQPVPRRRASGRRRPLGRAGLLAAARGAQ